jgi:hypothetical protein
LRLLIPLLRDPKRPGYRKSPEPKIAINLLPVRAFRCAG